ncbi:MAG: fructose-bisphosphatase class II family protein [Candidatus Omnitrophica bacterium]|nr:fructose-bisphosphatase class II family protein [Candidatus Omnitrophota bacterium]
MINRVLDLLRATEAAAIAASAWIGTGDKLGADKAATEAMRDRLNRIDTACKVVIGEGKKDHSSGLFAGERVGKLAGKKDTEQYELAVDPIDGTRPTVTSGPEAMSVLAVAHEKALFTTEAPYMFKIAYGPDIAKSLDLGLDDSIEKMVKLLSQATGKNPERIVVCMLDRPRHEKMISEFRRLKVRLKLIQDCDISGAIATCLPESGIDLLYGIGGAPEGVITACAMKCLKGGFKARVINQDGSPTDSKVYSIEELVKGDCAFVATGITNGSLLKGVRFTSRGPVTSSVMMRSQSGTVRWITSFHGN